MRDTRVECVALDGSVVQISGPAGLVESDYSSVGLASLRSLGLRSQKYAAGPLSFAQQMATSPGFSRGFHVREEFALQGGRLRIGSGLQHPDPDGGEYLEPGPDGRLHPSSVNFAIWEGLERSLYTLSYSREAADLIPVLDAMFITEREGGLMCEPKDPRLTGYVDGPRVLKDIPGVALLDISQLTPMRTNSLPSHQGTRVTGGELFVSARAAPGDYYFLMVSRSAITYVIPHARDADYVLSNIEHLDVSWTVRA